MLVTFDQVVAYWWSDEAHVRNWIANGTIPAPSVTGGLARWQEADLKQWEADGYPRSPEPTFKQVQTILAAIHREAVAKRKEPA
jgi:predicted DNA-binding transcriptional regulator AlpA